MALLESQATDLVSLYIEPNPHHPGPADVRLVDACVPVWAIVAYYQATGRDVAYVAEGYDVPEAAVRAALLYYDRHQAVIDARIEANAA